MINLEKVQAIYVGNIDTVQHDAVMKNGYVCNLGAKVTGNPEAFVVATPATATLGTEEVVLIASPEVMYEANKNISDFEIAANKPARAYHLTVGDVILFSDDLIDGTPVVGQYVIPQNGSLKLVAAADLSGGTRLAFKVDAQTTIGYNANTAWRLRVVKA